MKRILLAAVLVVATMAPLACQSEATVESRPGTGEPATSAIEDPGAEPRDLLQVRPTIGAESTRFIEFVQRVDATRTGETAVLDVSVTIEDMVTGTEDEPQLESTIVDVDLGAEARATLEREGGDVEAAIAELSTLVGESETTPIGAGPDAGQLSALGIDFDRIPALPEEPVGVGAQWTTSTTTRFEGATIAVEQSFELVELDETFIKVTTTSSGDFEVAGEVVTITGGGELTIDRATLQVIDGSLNQRAEHPDLIVDQQIEYRPGD